METTTSAMMTMIMMMMVGLRRAIEPVHICSILLLLSLLQFLFYASRMHCVAPPRPCTLITAPGGRAGEPRLDVPSSQSLSLRLNSTWLGGCPAVLSTPVRLPPAEKLKASRIWSFQIGMVSGNRTSRNKQRRAALGRGAGQGKSPKTTYF